MIKADRMIPILTLATCSWGLWAQNHNRYSRKTSLWISVFASAAAFHWEVHEHQPRRRLQNPQDHLLQTHPQIYWRAGKGYLHYAHGINYVFKKALSLTMIVRPFISVGAQVFSVVRKCINSGIFRKIETFRAVTCMCVVNNEYKNLQPILHTLKQILLQRDRW